MEKKKETKKKVNWKKIFKISVVAMIVIIIYGAGAMRGMLTGISIGAEKSGSSFCDVINKQEDEGGYCILLEDQKYEQRLECSYGKFIIKGESIAPPWMVNIQRLRRIVYSPIMGC